MKLLQTLRRKKQTKSQDRGARFYPFYLCGYP